VRVGQVQIDRGLFQIPMPKQDLNRTQICARLQQMRRKAVPQGTRVDVLVFESSASRGLVTRCPEHLGRDGPARRTPPVAREQPFGGLPSQPSPIGAQLMRPMMAITRSAASSLPRSACSARRSGRRR